MKLTNYIRDAFITSVMNDVPQKDFSEAARKAFLKAHLDTLPTEVQMAWVLHPQYLKFASPRVCGHSFAAPTDDQYRELAVPVKARTEINALEAQYKAQKSVHEELRTKIRGAAYACNTTKQLRELLPEFDRYLPAEEEKTLRTLPVVQNIVADFVKAGWPEKKKGAKT